VNGARRAGAQCTGTLAPDARDTATPTNGTPTSGTPTNGTHPSTRSGSRGARNGTHNGANDARSDADGAPEGLEDTRIATNQAHSGTTAVAPDAYGDGADNDTMDVDAASHGTAPGTVASGGDVVAGTPARPTTGVNGVHATNGHSTNGHGPNGHATNGQATDGHGPNGQAANGRAAHRQAATDRAAHRQAASGGVATGQAAAGRAANGQETTGGGANGQATNGRAPGGQPVVPVGGRAVGGQSVVNHTDIGRAPDGYVGTGNGQLGMGRGDGIHPFTTGTHERAESVTFGFGETAGVLPGDQRTFDDVEAGIVALWRRFGERREQPLRDRLVLHYAPLVKYVAGRVGTGLPAHVEVADLIQSGIFGLVDAIEKFEPERGLKFETYAMQRIRGAILDDLRAQDWVPRSVRGRAREVERALERLGAQLRRTPTDSELADALGLSLHELRDVYAQLQLTSVVALDELAAAGRGPTPLADILEDQEALDPVALLVDQDNRRQLAQAIAHLAERDRVVVTLYYFENLTLAEIGRVLGVTESRVCQLHTRAVLRLRAKLLEKSEV
jgi:RNA polymerase sigma factor FliA